MKHLFFYIIIISLTTFIFNSCNKNAIIPVEDPAGYQKDIAWPSVSNSAWPMYRCDPQNTGRTKSTGPKLGALDYVIDSGSIYFEPTLILLKNNSFASIGAKSNSGLYCYDIDGKSKWKYSAIYNFDFPSTPTQLSNGNIIFFAPNENGIMIIDSLGNFVRKINVLGSYQMDQNLGVGIDGTIYFIGRENNQNTMYAFDQSGNMKWSKTGKFSDGITFSPDGNSIYTAGDNQTSFYAVDATTGNIKWIFDKRRKSNVMMPVVDSYGNIYTIAGEKDNSEKWYVYSINPNGNVNWQWELKDTTTYIKEATFQITIDKLGNLYFGYEKVYSLDYTGKFRWEYALTDGILYSPLACDADNNIYFVTYNSTSPPFTFSRMIYKMNKEGNIVWKVNYPANVAIYSSYSPCLGNDRLFITTRGSKKIVCIK